jgi:hypothetical protein
MRSMIRPSGWRLLCCTSNSIPARGYKANAAFRRRQRKSVQDQSVVLSLKQPLPGYPEQRTSRDRPGWSGSCHKRSLWLIHWLGPVFRIGRNPAVRLFLGRKIPDMADGTISGRYSNGPTTVLDHFRMEFRFLVHPENTRLKQNGSIPQFDCRNQTEHCQKADRHAWKSHLCWSG